VKSFLKNLIGNWLFKKELDELERWKVITNQYHRWLTEFPEINMMFVNLLIEMDGKQSLCASRPPSKEGPWDIVGLRIKLRELVNTKPYIHGYVEDESVQEALSHYCQLLDNLGDLPIPDFESWCKKNYTRGTDILTKGNYFRSKYFTKEN
jgi:hypothetical protein